MGSTLFVIISFIYLMEIQAQNTASVDGGWTVWYSVDNPDDAGDDESWHNIKAHGFTICGSSTPLSARCRVKGGYKVFGNDSPDEPPNVLYEKCTEYGLVCRNRDQTLGSMCQDYEIAFLCPKLGATPNDGYNAENYGTVAMAAGLCVIVPLLIVSIAQVIKHRKDRAHVQRLLQAAQSPPSTPQDTTERCLLFQGPPTYDSLFGNRSAQTGSQESLIHSEHEQTGRASCTHNNNTESSNVFTISGSSNILPHSVHLGSSQGFRRLPGMHISVTDILTLESEDPILYTPPPDYNDAILKLAKPVDLPPKYTDIEDV